MKEARFFIAIGVAGLSLMSCAAPSSYAGISFAPGAAPTDLQELARRAQLGDKQAQLVLGIAYEEGRGLPIDVNRAQILYGSAALQTSGVIYVYQPSNNKGSKGRIVPVNTGPARPGLAEAKERLERLRDAEKSRVRK